MSLFHSLTVLFYKITVWFERCVSTSSANSYTSSNSLSGQPRAMSLDLEKQSANLTSNSQSEPVKPRRVTKHSCPAQTDTKIMVVWLESLEDHAQFPICNYYFINIYLQKLPTV